jgi:hypothetical protein
MTRGSTTEALPAAYERPHAYGPEFGGDEAGDHGMTNHGPVAVEVMRQILVTTWRGTAYLEWRRSGSRAPLTRARLRLVVGG